MPQRNGSLGRLRRTVSTKLLQLSSSFRSSRAGSGIFALDEGLDPRTSSQGAPELPPELLLPIFKELALNMYSGTFAYSFGQKSFLDEFKLNVVSKVSYDQQTDILNATKVNKAWRRAGTTILYQYPFLRSSSSITLFVKAMKESPALRQLVRGLVVVEQQDTRTYPRLMWFEKRLQAKDDGRARDALIDAFDSCSGMHSLVISARSQTLPCLQQFNTTLANSSSMGKNLRRLMLVGLKSMSDRPFLTTDVLLSSLEILSLREVHFTAEDKFPRFPSLRILNIVQCTHTTKQRITIVHGQFPVLDDAAFYQNDFIVGVGSIVLRRLKKLIYLEHNPTAVNQLSIMSKFRLEELLEFTYGVSDAYEQSMVLQSIPSPPKVEALCIIVYIKKADSLRYGRLEIANKLRDALSLPHILKSLKTLKLYVRTPHNSPTPVGKAFEQLRLTCLNRGITMTVIGGGTAFESTVNARVRDLHAPGLWVE